MSSKRLAVIAGVAHARGPAASPATGTLPPETIGARQGEREPPINLLLTGAFLSGVLMAMCAACYCCGYSSSRPRKQRVRSPGIYSVPVDCSHSALFCEDDPMYPPFRRPPTPGPPPSYDSVVSTDDKCRRYGLEDAEDKFEKYAIEGSAGPEELNGVVGGRQDDWYLHRCDISNRIIESTDENLPSSPSEVNNSRNDESAERDGDSQQATSSLGPKGILKNRLEDEPITKNTRNSLEDIKLDMDENLPTYEAALCIQSTNVDV